MRSELAKGRPRKPRLQVTYIHDSGPAVTRWKPLYENKFRLPGMSMRKLRATLLVGRCGVRINAPSDDPGNPTTVLMLFAYDLKNPDSMCTVAVPGYLFPGIKLNWVPLATLTRELELDFPMRFPPELERDCTDPDYVESMMKFRKLLRAFMNMVVDPEQRKWPEGWFVSPLGMCARCGKELTDITSQSRGVGPECYAALRELPAVRVLVALMERAPRAKISAAWASGVAELVRLGLAKAREREYGKPDPNKGPTVKTLLAAQRAKEKLAQAKRAKKAAKAAALAKTEAKAAAKAAAPRKVSSRPA